MKGLLDIRDHDRNIFETRYVYPVVSRRAGGVSVGINLNVNNACNWRCIYCQVPELVRGKAEDIDLKVLKLELEALLSNIKSGSFFEKFVPPKFRRLNDVALSGNGEPTSSLQLPNVLDIIQETKDRILKDPIVKTVLITNGSLLHSGQNPDMLRKLSNQNGEVWFKLDRVGREGRKQVNDINLSLDRIKKNLSISTKFCTTWIQACFFSLDGAPPDHVERERYIDFLKYCLNNSIYLAGVMIYGPSRKSYQPEANRISGLPQGWIESFCAEIRSLGIQAKFSP